MYGTKLKLSLAFRSSVQCSFWRNIKLVLNESSAQCAVTNFERIAQFVVRA